MISIFDFLSLSAIRFYQNVISPRKGYRCAYSVAYGGTGCSGFAKQAIMEHGFFDALPMIRHRFHDCANVADRIRTDIDCGCGALAADACIPADFPICGSGGEAPTPSGGDSLLSNKSCALEAGSDIIAGCFGSALGAIGWNGKKGKTEDDDDSDNERPTEVS